MKGTFRHATPGDSPALFALPHGLNVSGVTMWAVRLANAMAESGRTVGLITHAAPAGQTPVDIPIHQKIRRWSISSNAPALDKCNGDLTPFLPTYLCAIESLADAAGAPVIFSPNLVGDCYAIGAAVATTHPGLVRIIGWQHNDTEYDGQVLAHYEPIIGAFVGVSRHITDALRTRIPTRGSEIYQIPYGVRVPKSPPMREPITGRPLRLLYTGRIDHFQKRISILPEISAALDRMGVPHELRLLGDGPATEEIDARCETLPHCHRLGPESPAGVRTHLEWADALLLASRFEGLSVSMLEALAMGCPPIVSRVESGAAEAIHEGVNGHVLNVGEDSPEAIAGEFAHLLEELTHKPESLEALSRGAWESARENYSIERHVGLATAIFDRVQSSPARNWPADRPCGFTSSSSVLADATVPSDAGIRLRRVLQEIRAEHGERARVALWGGGRHTLALAAEIADPPVEIVAILDDDVSRHGGAMWNIPVIGANELSKRGVTDVVISSWMHQQAMWGRRTSIESQGAQVRRLYPGVGVERLPMRPATHVASAVA